MQPFYKVVLFDFDGTLANTNPLIVASFQYTLREKLGLNVSADDIYPHFGEPLPETMEFFAPGRGQELTDFYRVWNKAHHDQLIEQFAGMPETVAALHAAGVKLAVVTSKRTDMANQGLRVTGLAPYFDTVVGMELTARHKPEPDPALMALRQLNCVPGDDALMVGDSTFDILCGRNAGTRTAAVGWSVINRAELKAAGPDHWVESPADLLNLVLEGLAEEQVG